MRITGYRMIDLAAASTANAQGAVSDLSGEVSSGLRVTKPSDEDTHPHEFLRDRQSQGAPPVATDHTGGAHKVTSSADGWRIGVDGRKLYSGTALYTEQGRLCALGHCTWIVLK